MCFDQSSHVRRRKEFNPLNAELNPICHLLALLVAHLILHFSRIKVKRSRGNDENFTNFLPRQKWTEYFEKSSNDKCH